MEKNIYQSQIIAQNSADEIRQTKKMQKNTICVRAPTILVLCHKINDRLFSFPSHLQKNERNHCSLTFHNIKKNSYEDGTKMKMPFEILLFRVFFGKN